MEYTKSWSEIKSLSTSKNLAIQYVENTIKYEIFLVEGSITYTCAIWKDTSNVIGIDTTANNSDKSDFENNYKNNANKPLVPTTADRLPKILAAVSSDDVSLYISGNTLNVSSATSTVDSNFTTEIQLQGMYVAVKDAEWGDTLDVEVGYIDAQSNWVLIKKFANQVPMKDELGWQHHEYRNNAVSKIPATLKIRARYNSVSNLPKKLLIHYIAHR